MARNLCGIYLTLNCLMRPSMLSHSLDSSIVEQKRARSPFLRYEMVDPFVDPFMSQRKQPIQISSAFWIVDRGVSARKERLTGPIGGAKRVVLHFFYEGFTARGLSHLHHGQYGSHLYETLKS